MFSTNIAVIWFLFATCITIIIQTSAFPQSFEHNYVRIHIPVYKHTRHHTLTLVKKVPVPVPVPVPVLKEHVYKWYEKSPASYSFQEDDKESEVLTRKPEKTKGYHHAEYEKTKGYKHGEYEEDFESF